MNRVVGALSRRLLRTASRKATPSVGSITARSIATTTRLGAHTSAAVSVTTMRAAAVPAIEQTAGLRRLFSSEPAHFKLGMPALSPTMTHGNLVKWFKAEGDEINAGDVIAEVETDKASLEWDSQEDGYLAKILIPEGTSDVPLGTICALMAEEEADIAAVAAMNVDASAPAESAAPAETPAEAPAAPPAAAPTPVAPPAATPVTASTPAGGRVVASPLARATAASQGVPLEQVSGTGPNDRIIAADVREFVPGAVQATAAATGAVPVGAADSGAFTDLPNNNITKVAAERLTQAKQTIPHFYLTVDLNIDSLLDLRSELNAESNGDYKLSVNDFVVKASALSMRHVPEVNSQWGDEAIRRFHNVDISVAVDTDHGLQTPIVFDSDVKGLAGINADVKELAALAKDKKLKPDQFMGGTFTISNLGMFGVKQFCAIINPPQAAILAVGAAEKRVVSVGDDEFDWANVMTVTLSCDHRVIDGATGAKWLQHFKTYMENPTKMLL